MKIYLPFIAAAGVSAELFSQTGLYLRSYAPEILAEWLADEDAVDHVLSHGCFCAKLDNTNPFIEHLGGTDPLDELDEICKNWLKCRNCNDNLANGSCHADRETMRTGGYSMLLNRDDYSQTTCGFTTTDCAEDACAIDLQNLKSLEQFMRENPGHSATHVNAPGTCSPAPLDKRERKCMGSAPDVFPKRMSDLEQLFVRANWLTEKDEEDSIVYNDGGLKLNDKNEYIEIEVENQLIIFGWPNVQSFTVETVEDFNPYHVGWVEKANVNNFQGSDTLGFNTKGGVQTVGFFSGDASVVAHDGFSLADDEGRSFYYEGMTATMIKNTDGHFDFYVNGAFVKEISGDGWDGAYPAIDTDQRLKLRITDVVFSGDEIPCENGTSDGFTCTCDEGWEGMACNEAIPTIAPANCSDNYVDIDGECRECHMQTICPSENGLYFWNKDPSTCFGGGPCINMCLLDEGLGYLKLYEFLVNENTGIMDVEQDSGSGLWYDRGGFLGNVPTEMHSSTYGPVFFLRVGIWWNRPVRFFVEGPEDEGCFWIYRILRTNEPSYHDPIITDLLADGYELVPEVEAGKVYNSNSSYGTMDVYKKKVDFDGVLEVTTEDQWWSGGIAIKLGCYASFY